MGTKVGLTHARFAQDAKGGKRQGWNNRVVLNFIVVSGAVAERLSLSLSYPDSIELGFPF